MANNTVQTSKRLVVKKAPTSFNKYLISLLSRCKTRSQRKKWTSDLTIEQLHDIATKQKNRCIYSGMPLTFSKLSKWQASLERLNDNVPYIHGNVALCALEFNNQIQWSIEKAHYAATHHDAVDPSIVESNVKAARDTTCVRTGVPQRFVQQREMHGILEIMCNKCELWQLRTEYYKQVNEGCKTCKREHCKNKRSSWRGVLLVLLQHAALASKRRKAKGREHGFADLKFEDMVSMYEEQKGVCFYSGIPLTTKGDWKASLERKNSLDGYTRANCCLVAVEFNASDCSVMTASTDVDLGWSREKYAEFRTTFQTETLSKWYSLTHIELYVVLSAFLSSKPVSIKHTNKQYANETAEHDEVCTWCNAEQQRAK